MPSADDIRLQSAYERSLRMGDTAGASAFLSQIRARNQETQPVERPVEINRERLSNVYEPPSSEPRSMMNILDEIESGTRAASPEFTQALRNLREIHNRNAATQTTQNYEPDYEDVIYDPSLREGPGPVDPAYFADAEDIAASTRVNAATPFQNFLDEIGTEGASAQRIQEFATRKPQLAENAFNTSAALGGLTSRIQDKLTNFNDTLYEKTNALKTAYQSGDLVPGFISKPLGLKNPLVEPGGFVPAGTRLNPEAIRFLQEQKDLGSVLTRQDLDALGGHVTGFYNPEAFVGKDVKGPRLDVAFQSSTGYRDPSSIKQEKSKLEKTVNSLHQELKQPGVSPERVEEIENNLKWMYQDLDAASVDLEKAVASAKANPLTSEAVRYQLGSLISEAPEGTLITASPIGGATGGRARLYKSLSEGALETIPKMAAPDPSRMPSNEEFRLAWEGGGFSPEDYANRRYFGNNVATLKTGPEQFRTWANKNVQWNPETLKDPLIRVAFGMNKDVDVSALRQNPTDIFINTRPFDPSLPVISTSSPQYLTRQALGSTAKTIKPATKALLLDAGINYALGANPQEALVSAITDPISAEGLGGAPTAAIERRGPRGEFVDTRTNTVLTPAGRYTDKGIAIKGGKPIIVPRGSVAGEGNLLTQTRDVLTNAANVWRKRLGALGVFGR